MRYLMALTKKVSEVLSLLATFICYCFGVYLFIVGFTGLNVARSTPPAEYELYIEHFREIIGLGSNEIPHLGLTKTKYHRTVLIVIDALRADFVWSKSNLSRFFANSPFAVVNSLIKNSDAISFVSRAYTPTVTLPRIKTLLSGTLPSFLDVLTNFNVQQMEDDNLVSLASFSSKKIVFYGDDTWIRLFPTTFHRSCGTHSFYVADYTEVDDNVTRPMEEELKKDDWDIMVLHYLGVDHIGHGHGPLSPLLPKKLKEMDSIINHIYDSFKSGANELPDLIVLCSDHGMTITGNHGGNTPAELLTPLVFISTKPEKNVIGSISESISQVDIAATLSVLLGLPIPLHSMGIVIPEVLHFSGLTTKEVLKVMHYNLQQLYSTYKEILNKHSAADLMSIEETVARHLSWLRQCSHKDCTEKNSDYFYLLNLYMSNLIRMKNCIVSNASNFKSEYMVIGMTCAWSAVAIAVYCLSQFSIPLLQLYLYKKLMCFLFPVCGFVYAFDITEPVCALIVSFLIFYILIKFVARLIGYRKVFPILICLHVLSMGSTSFMEEEHQSWYFLFTTILLLFLRNHCIEPLVYWLHIKCRHPNQSLRKDSSGAVACVSLLVLHRIFRSWNQTGNKWLHLKDISSWLNAEGNSTTLLLFVAFSLFVLCRIMQRHLTGIPCFISVTGLLWALFYKCTIFGELGYFKNTNSRIMFFLAAILLVVVVARHTLFSMQDNFTAKKQFIYGILASWILLAITLCRVHNIPLILGVVVQEQLLNKLSWKENTDVVQNTLCYLVLTMCSFFYTGNSNSLSTIDVVSGYTGLSSYQPFIVGLFLACNTYCCTVIVLLLLFYRISCFYHVGLFSHGAECAAREQIYISCSILVLHRMLLLCVCMSVVYLQRYHLFILSVFAPKIVYELFHTFVFLVVAVFMYLFYF